MAMAARKLLQHKSPPSHQNFAPYGGIDTHLSPAIAIIIIALLTAILLTTVCALYIRHRCFANNHTNTGLPETPGRPRGLPRSVIESFPLISYSSSAGKDTPECSVCLTEFQTLDTLRALPACGHAFHKDCIGRWLTSHSTCPLCRRSLLPEKAGSALLLCLFRFRRAFRREPPDNGVPSPVPPVPGLLDTRAAPAGLEIDASTERPRLVRSHSTRTDFSDQSAVFCFPLLAADFHRSRSLTALNSQQRDSVSMWVAPHTEGLPRP